MNGWGVGLTWRGDCDCATGAWNGRKGTCDEEPAPELAPRRSWDVSEPQPRITNGTGLKETRSRGNDGDTASQPGRESGSSVWRTQTHSEDAVVHALALEHLLERVTARRAVCSAEKGLHGGDVGRDGDAWEVQRGSDARQRRLGAFQALFGPAGEANPS